MFSKHFERSVSVTSALILVLIWAVSARSAEIPHFSAYVNDYAHVLSDSDRNKLNQKLSDFDKNTKGHPQVVIDIIPSLQGQDINEYATETFNKNKLGRVENKNGLLTVLSIGDRKTKIETGYDIEPYVTDTKAKEILADMRSFLKDGNYYKAFDNETNTLMPLVAKASSETQTEVATDQTSPSKHTGFPFMSLIVLALLVAFLLYLFKAYQKSQITTKTPPDDDGGESIPPVREEYRRPASPAPMYRPRPTVIRDTYVPPEPYVPPTPQYTPQPPVAPKSNAWGSAAAGGLAGFAASELLNSTKKDDDSSSDFFSTSNSNSSYNSNDSSNSSSSNDSSSSSSSDSFSGGGSSDSYGSGGGGASDGY